MKKQTESTTNNTAQANKEKIAEPTDMSLTLRQTLHQSYYGLKSLKSSLSEFQSIKTNYF